MITNSSSVNLSTLAAEVAKNLPGQWSAAPIHDNEDSNQFLIRESDGLKLFFAGSRGGWAAKGKLHVSLSRPRVNGSWVSVYEGGKQVTDPDIGLAETKTPEQIAQSIVSRLLTEAETVFAKVNAQIAADDSEETAKNELISLFAAATGQHEHNGSFAVSGFDFDVRSATSVAIRSYGTDADTAIEIARWLKARETVASE